MNKVNVIFASLAATVIYIVLFPQSSGKEFVLQAKTVIVNNELPKNQNTDSLHMDRLSRTFISPISIFNKKESRSLVGLLNGRFYILDDTDSIIFEYMPAGSRIKGVYGGTLSEDGLEVALISGLEPQRFLLLKERAGSFHFKFQHRLETDFRRPVFMKFVSDDRFVVFEGNNGVVAVDGENGSFRSLGMEKLIDIWEINTDKGIIALLGHAHNGKQLTILSQLPPGSAPLLRADIPMEIQSMRVEDERIYLLSSNRRIVMETSIQ